MFREISYFLILGRPLIMYTGILTLIAFLFTALVGILNRRGTQIIPFKWHPRLAIISLSLAIIHGAMGLLANL